MLIEKVRTILGMLARACWWPAPRCRRPAPIPPPARWRSRSPSSRAGLPAAIRVPARRATPRTSPGARPYRPLPGDYTVTAERVPTSGALTCFPSAGTQIARSHPGRQPVESATPAYRSHSASRKSTTVERAVFLTSPPGDRARQFIVQRDGRIRVLVNGMLLPRPSSISTSACCPGRRRPAVDGLRSGLRQQRFLLPLLHRQAPPRHRRALA